MRPAELNGLLRRVRRGDLAPAAAARQILNEPLEKLEFATLDHERSLRAGFPEVVFGPGKTPQQLVAILGRLFRRSGVVLATRVSAEGREAVRRAFPRAEVYERSGAVVLRRRASRSQGRVLVVCAGTDHAADLVGIEGIGLAAVRPPSRGLDRLHRRVTTGIRCGALRAVVRADRVCSERKILTVGNINAEWIES